MSSLIKQLGIKPIPIKYDFLKSFWMYILGLFKRATNIVCPNFQTS